MQTMSLNWGHYTNHLKQSGSVGLRRYIGIGRLPVQNPLSTWPGLATQSLYEAPGDLQVEHLIKMGCLTSGLLRLPS